MKLKLNGKDINLLWTCHHVISNDDIKNRLTVNLYYGEKKNEIEREITLDKNIRFIRTFKNEDVTLVEIIEEDDIPEDKYLNPDLNYEQGYKLYLEDNFYLAGYPKKFGERCISAGKITKITDLIFEHKLDTYVGSSGWLFVMKKLWLLECILQETKKKE